jgi:hypothetical protein
MLTACHGNLWQHSLFYINAAKHCQPVLQYGLKLPPPNSSQTKNLAVIFVNTFIPLDNIKDQGYVLKY